mmetsp:Transcript_63709/g.71177  ORF Transcript_63709/g.71177 Transcript_63709/m.71177 type:complete len:126 (+) Transcript_63709:342-719(+)
MLRVLFLLLIVLTMNNIDQTQGFVVAGGCGSICDKRISGNSNSNSMMGKTIIIQNNQHSNELPVTTTPQQQMVPSTTSSTITSTGTTTEELSLSSSSSSLLTFDSDLFRQEMIDLVYQRNLQRCL